MQNISYAAIMLLAGIGILVLAALNAALGQRIGSAPSAAVILFIVALLVALVASIATGPTALLRAREAPPHLFLAGTLVAFYVLSITAITPRFGVGNAVFFVLVGQLLSASVIDHFGLFGAQVRQLGAFRIVGLSLMTIGILLTQRA